MTNATNTTTMPLGDLLRSLCACSDAVTWAMPYATLDEAWAACPRADWMLWLAGRLAGPERASAGRRALVLCACACARTALVHVRAGERRPLAAIEISERWARGEQGVTAADVRDASAAAHVYAMADTVRAAPTHAAYAAAATAYFPYYAASHAADAAACADAASAAAYASDADARHSHLRALANLVRQHYPQPPEDLR